MRTALVLPLLIAGLAAAAPVLAADSPEEAAIKAREGVMHIRAFNLGNLVAMVKQEVPYDADAAQTYAGNLKTLNQVDMRSAWMEGTSVDQYIDSRAKPEIWTSGAKFADHAKQEAEAADKLAAVAGDGLQAMAPAVKDLAQTCKNCHDDYRTD